MFKRHNDFILIRRLFVLTCVFFKTLDPGVVDVVCRGSVMAIWYHLWALCFFPVSRLKIKWNKTQCGSEMYWCCCIGKWNFSVFNFLNEPPEGLFGPGDHCPTAPPCIDRIIVWNNLHMKMVIMKKFSPHPDSSLMNPLLTPHPGFSA